MGQSLVSPSVELVGIKIWDNLDKKPFLGGKNPLKTTVKPLYNIRDTSNWTLWVIFLPQLQVSIKIWDNLDKNPLFE